MGRGRPTTEDFYGDAARAYHEAKWMRRNQRQTTVRALQLLEDPNLDGEEPWGDQFLVLDLGCGSGFSLEVCIEAGATVVGVDISWDMLHHALGQGFHLVHADLQHLPFRDEVFPYTISISTLNFITEMTGIGEYMEEIYQEAFEEVHRVTGQGGRCVFEYYPRDDEELNCSTSAARGAGFTGFLVKDQPGTRKEQLYLLLARDLPPSRET